ncbi:unnamed protein product [Pleuronectes platessa]|uniref:Uncharacterized protein n=1 Tax=Pleuronectes platessa TaxID=8262 RepID=A0A9N7YPV1_PLEPL|nr:unnamed protein product [Pleuronectes platessa]
MLAAVGRSPELASAARLHVRTLTLSLRRREPGQTRDLGFRECSRIPVLPMVSPTMKVNVSVREKERERQSYSVDKCDAHISSMRPDTKLEILYVILRAARGKCWQGGAKLMTRGSDAPGSRLSARLMEGATLGRPLTDRCQPRPSSSGHQVGVPARLRL